ncbi:MAG: DUF362 domain-containing protein [Lentisphaeraceae bacterium]|nr:DUF362 domain-containing protein [Lentisphaeraceae bacterium]
MIELISQKTYDRKEISEKLKKLFEARDVFNTLLAGKKSVLLKPNFVVPEKPEDCATTHPDFYMSLAIYLQSKGFEVGIGESPAFGSCKKALKFHGVLEECRERKIKIVEFKNPETFEGLPDISTYKTLTIASELQNWDAIINLPKLKVHQQFTFTAATKNLYGCVTGMRKFVRHSLCKNDPARFGRMVVANAHKANCILHIGDGIQAMHVKGPRGGKPYPLGKIIFSDDFLAHDWLTAKLMGIDPMKTPLFQCVSEEERANAEVSCKSIVESDTFEVAEGFKHSYLIDISFSPWHLLRSGWRSLKFNLKRA